VSAGARRGAVRLAIVVAVAENGVIGRAGGLPWRVRADLKRFRALTIGKPVVMGRKTFESIGRVLDGRDNIVVTERRDFAPEGVLVAHGVEPALGLARKLAETHGADEFYVIGGGQLYAETLPLADRLYVTHVAAAPDGDVRFPPIAPAEWQEIVREPLPSSEGDTAAAARSVYQRRG
jgi:dihydrofolate reductase